jgi:hypothetical protein
MKIAQRFIAGTTCGKSVQAPQGRQRTGLQCDIFFRPQGTFFSFLTANPAIKSQGYCLSPCRAGEIHTSIAHRVSDTQNFGTVPGI